jgi:GNAT acetyltransferase, Mec-17
MLQKENTEPRLIAYDRPSPKLFGFLKKHYGLSSHVPQNNNYVVFNAYWEVAPLAFNDFKKDFKYRSTRNEEVEAKQPLKLNTKQENKIESSDKYGAYEARQQIVSLKKGDINDRKTTYGTLYRPDSENTYSKDTRYNRPETAILDKRSSNNISLREEYKKSDAHDYSYDQKIGRFSAKGSQRTGPSEDDMKTLQNKNVASEKKRQEQKSSCPWATNDVRK